MDAYNTRRHVGMIAKEGKVELIDGDGGVADTLHADVREVDVEVPAEEPEHLGDDRVVLFELVEPGTAQTVRGTVNDAVVPCKLLTERTGRRREDLARVGSGVVRPTPARRVVGEPVAVHR